MRETKVISFSPASSASLDTRDDITDALTTVGGYENIDSSEWVFVSTTSEYAEDSDIVGLANGDETAIGKLAEAIFSGKNICMMAETSQADENTVAASTPAKLFDELNGNQNAQKLKTFYNWIAAKKAENAADNDIDTLLTKCLNADEESSTLEWPSDNTQPFSPPKFIVKAYLNAQKPEVPTPVAPPPSPVEIETDEDDLFSKLDKKKKEGILTAVFTEQKIKKLKIFEKAKSVTVDQDGITVNDKSCTIRMTAEYHTPAVPASPPFQQGSDEKIEKVNITLTRTALANNKVEWHCVSNNRKKMGWEESCKLIAEQSLAMRQEQAKNKTLGDGVIPEAIAISINRDALNDEDKTTKTKRAELHDAELTNKEYALIKAHLDAGYLHVEYDNKTFGPGIPAVKQENLNIPKGDNPRESIPLSPILESGKNALKRRLAAVKQEFEKLHTPDKNKAKDSTPLQENPELNTAVEKASQSINTYNQHIEICSNILTEDNVKLAEEKLAAVITALSELEQLKISTATHHNL